jgi:hypothetical protein
MEIQRAMQELQDSTVDASNHTPYFPDEIWELALINDRYVLKLVFDIYDFANF